MSLINYYEIIPTQYKHVFLPDKNFNKHLIEPCSNILITGPTGTGKTNSLMNFLHLKNNTFVDVIIFTGSTSDEPLYNFFKAENPEVKIIDTIEDLPDLEAFKDADKSFERLVVFDDVAHLSKKIEDKLKNFIKASRKYGFTCVFIYQSYTSCPKFIRDNCNIFFIFRQSSNLSLKYLLREKNPANVSFENLMKMYDFSTRNKSNFFNIDTKANPAIMFRKNFTEIL